MKRFVAIYGHFPPIVFYQMIPSLLICDLYSCRVGMKKIISKEEASNTVITQELISAQRNFYWKCAYLLIFP